ncbi:hypothetical protein HZH66_008722 [Vespula vulgaris]|uniref:Uncharacterized protein n=1 Tax=Vespula vulgaris TaxID=7454 RepID=A0A834JQU3_VESVU|nr:hypothetical protein HZH66_008722 [Vespula vulgaris]
MVKYPLRRDNLPFYFLVTFNVYGGGSSEGRGRDYSGGTSISMVLMVVVGGWWWWWWPLSACLETARKMHGVDAPAPMRIASSTAKAILSAISVMGSRHWVVGVVEQGLHHVKIITRFCFVRCRAVPCIDMSVRLIALKPTRLMKIVMHCVGPNKYKQRLSTMCFMGKVWG